MAADQFHDTFWVAIATAAPVIGLASAVTADQLVRRSERAADRAESHGLQLPPLRMGAFWFAYTNIIAQSIILFVALVTLSNRVDGGLGRFSAALIEFLGMLMVFTPTVVALSKEGRRRREPPAQTPVPPE
jgi:hypothetical protein